MGEQDKGRPVVLVVEDEFLILMDAVDLVNDAGFKALPAGNATEAVSILEGRGDIRVVFTDVNMPGAMDGLTLAVMVRDRWPPIGIIVTSGLKLEMPQLPEGGLFFPKPYTPEQIVGAIHSFTD